MWRIGKDTGMAADESQKQERSDRWSKEWREKSSLLRHWWIFVISGIRSWSHNFPKYKGRVVLRGDIVKDGSGSYAVFTEQGSSASHMTAANVMDVIARLPGCAGQAADAVSAYTQVKNEDDPFVIEKSEVRMCRYLGTSTETQLANIFVQYGRSRRSSWAKSVWSAFDRTIMGKAIRESSVGTRLGKGSTLGMFVCKPWRRTILVSVCGRPKNWLERNRTSIQCVEYLWKILIWANRHHALTMFVWVALNGNVKQARILQTICRNMCRSQISAGATEKLSYSVKLGANIFSWSYDVEGHAKKCVDRYCELANSTTQQLCKVATPCLDDHQFKQEEMRSVGDLPKSVLANCFKMHVFGAHWWTRHSLFREQTFTCCHQMDQSLRQTFSTFDLLHSSHEWWHTILPCG